MGTAAADASRSRRETALRRVVPTVAAVLAVALFVTAGNWQRGRMQAKQQLGEAIVRAESMAPMPLPQQVDDWTTWQFRSIDAIGRYDASRQILIDNRVHAGRVGYHVVTPLQLSDGRAVLVNRGFVAAGPTRADLPDVPPPAGEVSVRGTVRLPPSGYLELAQAVPGSRIWQNLDVRRFTTESGLDVLPIVVEQTGDSAGGLVRAWRRPDTGVQTHRVYMVQWYAFAALTTGAWAWFTFRRRRDDAR